MYEVLETRKQILHPDKTSMGRVEKTGFDFLGMRIFKTRMTVGQQSITRTAANIFQLYEQGSDFSRICVYWRRWVSWICSGIPVVIDVDHWVSAVLEALKKFNPPDKWLAELSVELRQSRARARTKIKI
jgi:hypothetical protein